MTDDGLHSPTTTSSTTTTPLHDEQNTRDTRELAIDKVGVKGLRFPIQVRDRTQSAQNKLPLLECLSIYQWSSKALT